MTLGVLIALDDLLLGDLFEAAFRLDALQVFDRLSAWLMDHPKGNRAFRRGGRKHPHRYEDEGKAKIARPDGDGSHGDTRERYRLYEFRARIPHHK